MVQDKNKEIARLQILAIVALLGLWAFTGQMLILVLALVAIVYPKMNLKHQRTKKIERLEMQLDGSMRDATRACASGHCSRLKALEAVQCGAFPTVVC